LNHARGEGDDTPGFGIVIVGTWFFADAVSPDHYFGIALIIAGSMTLKLLAYATLVPGPWRAGWAGAGAGVRVSLL